MSNLQSLLSNLISGDDEQAESAAHDLAAFGSEAVPFLQELLDSPDTDQRWWATRTLALIVDPQAVNLLLESLSDPDIAVRQCAALALKKQPVPDAIPKLIEAIDDPDQLLSRLATNALIASGAMAVPELVNLLEKGSQHAKGEAARALALIGDKRAIPAMFTEWEKGSSLVQYWIEEGFRRMGVGMTFFNPDW